MEPTDDETKQDVEALDWLQGPDIDEDDQDGLDDELNEMEDRERGWDDGCEDWHGDKVGA